MELRHLRYFVAVAEVLNFHRAAEALAMAQPPLSLQIQQLERELGVTLLDRTARKIQLTDAGRVFLRDATAILAQAEAATQRAKRAERGEVGHLTIGYTSLILSPLFRSAECNNLLSKNIERRLRNNQAVQLTLMDGSHQGSTFDQFVARGGKESALGNGATPMAGTAKTLQSNTD